MFTILIPALKQGFLHAQLHWLSQQTYKDFVVIAMDVNYPTNQYQPWAKKTYPFVFHHVPLVHNTGVPKRCDFSVKNNLALLAPTNEFLFLSDTAYVVPSFARRVSEYVMQGKLVAMDSTTVLYNTYDESRKAVDISGQTDHLSQPSLLFNRKIFFHILNGFDEATTMGFPAEFVLERMVNTGYDVHPEKGMIFHIMHNSTSNSFGKFWRRPCDKCNKLFPSWRFSSALETGEFPIQGDPAIWAQMMFRDPDLGIPMFECGNCGFGGCCNPATYRDLIVRERYVDAPKSALDGRTGRDLGKVYETMTSQVESSLKAKIAYLKTTY